MPLDFWTGEARQMFPTFAKLSSRLIDLIKLLARFLKNGIFLSAECYKTYFNTNCYLLF